MRARNIKPDFFLAEAIAECDFGARLLYIGLWCYADRAGRFAWQPRRIKAALFPYDDLDITPWLDQLVTHRALNRYTVQGQEFAEIVGFLSHQKPHPHEAPSGIPPFVK